MGSLKLERHRRQEATESGRSPIAKPLHEHHKSPLSVPRHVIMLPASGEPESGPNSRSPSEYQNSTQKQNRSTQFTLGPSGLRENVTRPALHQRQDLMRRCKVLWCGACDVCLVLGGLHPTLLMGLCVGPRLVEGGWHNSPCIKIFMCAAAKFQTGGRSKTSAGIRKRMIKDAKRGKELVRGIYVGHVMTDALVRILTSWSFRPKFLSIPAYHVCVCVCMRRSKSRSIQVPLSEATTELFGLIPCSQ